MGQTTETPTGAENGAVAKAGALRIEMRDPRGLREYENNARRITERAVSYIADSIRQVGFVNPVVITQDGVIVCGHASTRAAIEAGVGQIPCVVVDDLTDEQVKAFRLADNKTAAMAIWDMDKLKEEMAKLTGVTAVDMGFDEEMLTDVQSQVGNDTDNSDAEPGVKNTSEELDLDGDFGDDAFEHECPHCGLKF